MASERADGLADEFASANEDAITFVRRLVGTSRLRSRLTARLT